MQMREEEAIFSHTHTLLRMVCICRPFLD
jgi:hypothetical protein